MKMESEQRMLYRMDCKHLIGWEQCFLGGLCLPTTNCRRMKYYDKKFLNNEDNERNSN